jgi:transmembrane protein EpsG
MIVYWGVFIAAIIINALQSSEKARRTIEPYNYIFSGQRTFWQVIFSLFPAIFFFGLRSRVGDTSGYYNAFLLLPKEFTTENLDQRAVGFDLLRRFCKSYIFSSPEAWLMLILLLSIIPMSRTLSRYSFDIHISLYIFFASTEFLYLINGARQFLAVCICFYSLKYLLNDDPIRFFLTVFLAMSVHLTAIVMLPVYFAVRTKPWSPKMILILILGVFLSFFSSSAFSVFDEYVLSDTVYSRYASYFVSYKGVKTLRVLVQCVPVIISFLKRRQIEELNSKLANICVNISVLNAIVFIFASTMGGNLSGRIAEYYTIFNLILYPILLSNVMDYRERKLIRFLAHLLFLAFFIYQMQIAFGGLEYTSNYLRISLNAQ